MADATGAPPNPARRRRPRLSVRGLMLLVLLIGGGLGWFDLRARAQRDAVAAVEAAGGWAHYDFEFGIDGAPVNAWTRRLVDVFGVDRVAAVVGVRGGSGFDDATLRAVGRLSSLRELELYDCPVTDAGVTAGLAGLRRLETFALLGHHLKLTRAIVPAVGELGRLDRLDLSPEGLKLEDADLDRITRLSRLRDLSIRGPGITDAGLAHLGRLPALEKFTLLESSVTGAGLGHLSRCKALADLYLDRARVTTLEPLRDLPNLAEVTIQNCPLATAWTTPVTGLGRLERIIFSGLPLTDAGLAHLGGLPGLKSLDLHQSGITDAGLPHVARCAGLEELSLSSTAITTLEPIRNMPRLDQIAAQSCPLAVAWKTPVTGLDVLRNLDLYGSRVAGAGLARLGDLPSVSFLTLSRTKADDAGLAAIGSMKSLAHLHLDGTAVTDAGLAHLVNLATLQDVDLTGTAVGDAGVPHLLRIPGAPEIILIRTRLTDAGLRQLAAPGGFRGSLLLGGPSLTAEGVRAAQNANPRAKIFVHPGDEPPPASAGAR